MSVVNNELSDISGSVGSVEGRVDERVEVGGEVDGGVGEEKKKKVGGKKKKKAKKSGKTSGDEAMSLKEIERRKKKEEKEAEKEKKKEALQAEKDKKKLSQDISRHNSVQSGLATRSLSFLSKAAEMAGKVLKDPALSTMPDKPVQKLQALFDNARSSTL